MWGAGCGVWGVGCGVWGVGRGVWGVGWWGGVGWGGVGRGVVGAKTSEILPSDDPNLRNPKGGRFRNVGREKSLNQKECNN